MSRIFDYIYDKIIDKVIDKLDPTGIFNFNKAWDDANDTTKILDNLNRQCKIAYDNHDTERAAIYEWGINEIEKLLHPQVMNVIKSSPKGTTVSGPVTDPKLR
jgi:hypothetical protein